MAHPPTLSLALPMMNRGVTDIEANVYCLQEDREVVWIRQVKMVYEGLA